jgi:CRP-like cAMP-binding protein
VRNRVLRLLSPRDYRALSNNLERVSFPHGQPLWRAGQPIDDVYFVESGLVSVTVEIDRPGPVEIAVIGREGLVGVPACIGRETSTFHAQSQVAVDAYRITLDRFRSVVDESRPLKEVLSCYLEALFAQIAQLSACNCAHPIEQRCARRLLMMLDHTARDEFPMTQEKLAEMLGVRRATINEVANAFQSEGLIRYARGNVRITNRRRLERTSCACYRIITDRYDRFLRVAPRSTRAHKFKVNRDVRSPRVSRRSRAR